jgi:hypothetical protein
MEILKGVLKKSAVIIVPSIALAAYFLHERTVPMGIFAGWVFGILNLTSLTRSVQGFIDVDRSKMKLVFLNIFRLLGMFAVIIVLLYYRLINVLGLLYGFTVVFVLILIEGIRIGKSQ